MRYILLVLIAIVLAGCGNGEEQEPSNATQTEEASQTLLELRNVDVQVEGLNATLNGEVSTLGDVLFYRIEQGESELQEEKELDLSEGSEWEAFKIEVALPEEVEEREDAPIVVIYGKTESGETVNPNYIPIDIFTK